MPKEIVPVQSKKQLDKFIRLPWKIYKDNPHWVPQLISAEKQVLSVKKGPFFANGEAQFFMVTDSGTPLGRISAHCNFQYEKYRDAETGFFGFFECVDDQKAADALVNAATNWLAERGKKRVLGPMSFNLYDISGCLISGFDTPPVIMTAYNPPYYRHLLENAGMQKAIDWFAFTVKDSVALRPALFRVRDRALQQPELEIKTLDMKNLDQHVREIGKIFSEAWMENWGHVPLTEQELDHMVKDLKPVVVPELTYLAYWNGEVIGFSLSVKDANPALAKANGRLFPFGLIRLLTEMNRVHKLRTIAMGVMKPYRHKGIDIIFYLNTIEHGRRMGYKESECSIIVETNDRMINALEDLQAEKYKTFRFYEKEIL